MTSTTLRPFEPSAHVLHSTETNERAQVYRDAIRKERAAETSSIIAAWEAGHAFRQYEDPVTAISALTGMSETYINKRIRLAGAYSWAFNEGTHASNQMFKHRNVHVPAVHWQYFEAIQVDVGKAVKEFLEVVSSAELHAILKKYVVE